ncbi:MAG: hypothetical protein ABIK82_03310 [Pseudomonadota bacterium]
MPAYIASRRRWIVIAALSAPATYWLLSAPIGGQIPSQMQVPIPVSSVRPSETAPTVGVESSIAKHVNGRVDLFAPRTWEPPPPPVVPVSVPHQSPQAPPLPFKFFGRIQDPGQAPSFILSRGAEMITVRVGDRIEPAYLVDKFDGTQLHLVYVPMNIRQTIFVGNSNE